jgi:hypothetical protein
MISEIQTAYGRRGSTRQGRSRACRANHGSNFRRMAARKGWIRDEDIKGMIPAPRPPGKVRSLQGQT